MNNKRQLKDSGKLLTIGLLRNGALALSLILISNYLGPDQLGNYSLGLAIATPIFVFSQFGLRGVFLTKSAPHKFSSYFIVGSVGSIFAITTVTVLSLIFYPELIFIFIFIALIKSIDAISDLLTAPYQASHRLNQVVVAYGTATLTSTIGVWVVLNAGGNLVTSLAMILILNSLIFSIFLFPKVWRHSSEITPPLEQTHRYADIRSIFLSGLPLGVAAGIIALTSSSPQIILENISGPAAVGLLGILLYAYGMAELLIGSIAQSWLPHTKGSFLTAESSDDFLKFLSRQIRFWTLAIAPVALLGAYLLYVMMPIIFGKEFQLTMSVGVPLVLLICLIPAMNFTGTALLIANLYSREIWLAIVSAVMATLCSLILIPQLGIAGALYSLLLALVSRIITARMFLRGHHATIKKS